MVNIVTNMKNVSEEMVIKHKKNVIFEYYSWKGPYTCYL